MKYSKKIRTTVVALFLCFFAQGSVLGNPDLDSPQVEEAQEPDSEQAPVPKEPKRAFVLTYTEGRNKPLEVDNKQKFVAFVHGMALSAAFIFLYETVDPSFECMMNWDYPD